MLQYSCVDGQSFSDVCMNTYGSMDFYIKLLNDNELEPNQLPTSGQLITWDDTVVKNQTIQQLTNKNKIIFATLTGYGVPEQENPNSMTYKDIFSASYTATSEGETLITIIDLQGHEVVQIEQEIKPLKSNEYIFNSTNGTIQLVDTSLAVGETLFIIYKKTINV